MVWTTVHIAQTGAYALYLAQNVQYNAHSFVEISPIEAQILSDEY
jgi:hypothetical protein